MNITAQEITKVVLMTADLNIVLRLQGDADTVCMGTLGYESVWEFAEYPRVVISVVNDIIMPWLIIGHSEDHSFRPQVNHWTALLCVIRRGSGSTPRHAPTSEAFRRLVRRDCARVHCAIRLTESNCAIQQATRRELRP